MFKPSSCLDYDGLSRYAGYEMTSVDNHRGTHSDMSTDPHLLANMRLSQGFRPVLRNCLLEELAVSRLTLLISLDRYSAHCVRTYNDPHPTHAPKTTKSRVSGRVSMSRTTYLSSDRTTHQQDSSGTAS